MSGTTTDPSIPFDPYTAATSFDPSQLQTYPDFSPESFFDKEEFDTDFTSDSTASPMSPPSPAHSASSFGFPTTDPWTAWDSVEFSPEPEKLFECQTPSSCSPPNASSGPVINPLDLTVPPLFQSPQVLLATVPGQQQPTAAAPATSSPQSTASPSANTAAPKRYPSRGLKRKSAGDPSDSERAPKSAAISPRTTRSTTGRSSTISATPRSKSTSPTTPATLVTSAPKKTAHNMVEKRYRTNLNDKITLLRDAVPALRLLAKRTSIITDGIDGDETEETGPGAGHVGSGGGRLNKATILTKATEYITQLERRLMGLETENQALRGRMEGLELMMTGRAALVAGAGGSSGGGIGLGVAGDGGAMQVLGGWN